MSYVLREQIPLSTPWLTGLWNYTSEHIQIANQLDDGTEGLFRGLVGCIFDGDPSGTINQAQIYYPTTEPAGFRFVLPPGVPSYKLAARSLLYRNQLYANWTIWVSEFEAPSIPDPEDLVTVATLEDYLQQQTDSLSVYLQQILSNTNP